MQVAELAQHDSLGEGTDPQNPGLLRPCCLHPSRLVVAWWSLVPPSTAEHLPWNCLRLASSCQILSAPPRAASSRSFTAAASRISVSTARPSICGL